MNLFTFIKNSLRSAVEDQKQESKVWKTILFFAAVLLLLTGAGKIRLYILDHYGIYTIGTVQHVKKSKHAYTLDCYYHYKGKVYNASGSSTAILKKDENRKIVVKILPSYPWFYKRYPEYQVPDTITAIPQEGWKYLPRGIFVPVKTEYDF